ncbi:NLP/P60 protein [Chloroherpeton thalassium ATCC 35110]|uniref:NLP/P60 protein n=1 Tax=Chloroherpeton thalassium (strain ATCC 35110 / GB-78) TaxID=517418 RepID=B3QXH1_CHLT3|nr:NlpC/P60 family protein [Chloroherpeton thalassium]ACF13445.1 NLP/P60 protein [Chloroherpeton thalassium ATCC 35110]
MRLTKVNPTQHRLIFSLVALFLASVGLSLTACQSSNVASRYNKEPEEVCVEMEVKKIAPTNEERPASTYSPNSEIAHFSPRSSAASRLKEEIKKYLGVKYRYGGMDKTGMDCSGLIFRVFINAFDLILPHSTAALSQLGRSVPKTQLRFGDLVFFSEQPRKVTHVGIYVGKGQFVHASSSSGVIISSLEQRYYRQRYKDSRRIVTFQ